jgi:hypothetical protein
MQRTATHLAGLALLLAGMLFSLPASAQAIPPSCPSGLATTDLIDHDFSVSFCELCEIGTVRIEIENPFRNNDDADFSDIVVTENLLASGLTYVPGTTSFDTDNVPTPPVVEPVVSGTNGSVLTWTLSDQFVMDTRSNGAGSGAIRRLRVEFNVRRHPSVGEEGLVGANRNIDAQVEFTPSCDTGYRHTASTGPGELPLREPEPEVIKTGRVVDAGQGAGQYTSTIYGHENDDAIWRIEVINNGTADLQDFVFDDTMQPGNFEIDWICDSEGEANGAATGGGTGDCESVGPTTDLNNVDVAQLFGGAGTYVVAPPGGNRYYYLVGRITDSCSNHTNTVDGVEWGCEVDAPAGGITATSLGQVPAPDVALLSTRAVDNQPQVDVFLEGTNLSQPMGTKGTVSIRIENLTGGTIKGGVDGLKIRNVLPPEYVVDPTFEPELIRQPAYGTAYPGMVDTVTWTNPQPGTYPSLTSNDPADPLANTAPEFSITSAQPHPDFSDQEHMIRHGDVVIVRFRVVLIDPAYYDLEAYVDVRQEQPASDPPGTDPPESFPINTQTEVWWEEFCTNTEHYRSVNDNDTAEPEDIDVDVSGSQLNFILTNTDTTPLTVQLRNRGGHDARDYFAYVTFGEAMEVATAPGSCSVTTNPPPMPEWQLPVGIPASATVYACTPGFIRPGQTRSLNFQVRKNPNAADDDLTFRADVTGEVTLSDGTPLWFPTPQQRGDGILPRANDYTVDALRARVVGYNLTKEQLGTCSENNPPPTNPDDQVQIGEECEVHIESGGWFGFETPGYDYIEVENVQVVDRLPDGQGYISSTDPKAPGYSTDQVLGVSLNPPPAPLAEGAFDWTHNQANRITVKDHWFRVDATTRLLNDPLDVSAAPNVHAALSRNVRKRPTHSVRRRPATRRNFGAAST